MFIQFGNLKIKLLIPILFPIFLKLRRTIRKKNDIKSPVFKGFNDFLSLSLCGIFFLIIKINMKSKKKINNKNVKLETELKVINDNPDLQSDNISLKGDKSKKNIIEEIKSKDLTNKMIQIRKKTYYIILISLLELIAIIIKNIWRYEIADALILNIAVLMEIIFMILFSMIFLGLKLYSHQIFSIIGISIILLIFFIESILFNEIGFKEILLTIIYYFAVQLFYCLSDVLGKRYLNSFIDNIYSFLFKIGIVGLIPLTIYGIIVSFTDINVKYKIFQNFTNISPRIYILDLFFSILFEIGVWLTIYYFTPCHYIIFECIADFLEIIVSELEDNKSFDDLYCDKQKITFYILYPILILIVLIFNEIIILNFCNLSYNTKDKIMEREKNENFSSNINENRLMANIIEDDDDDDGEGGYII